MSLQLTAILFAVGLAIIGAVVWIESRPRNDAGARLRRLPTTPFLMLGIFIALLSAIHLLSFVK